MNASDMNKLLYCLITAPFVDSDGLSEYVLGSWSGLNGTLNPYLIQEMIDRAPELQFLVIDSMTALSVSE